MVNLAASSNVSGMGVFFVSGMKHANTAASNEALPNTTIGRNFTWNPLNKHNDLCVFVIVENVKKKLGSQKRENKEWDRPASRNWTGYSRFILIILPQADLPPTHYLPIYHWISELPAKRSYFSPKMINVIIIPL